MTECTVGFDLDSVFYGVSSDVLFGPWSRTVRNSPRPYGVQPFLVAILVPAAAGQLLCASPCSLVERSQFFCL